MNDRRASFSIKAITGIDCFHVSLVTFSLLVSLRLRQMNTECTQACDVSRIINGTSKACAFLHRCHWGGAVSAGLKGDHGHDGVTVWGEGACCGPRGFR